jgi:hypothetical protein
MLIQMFINYLADVVIIAQLLRFVNITNSEAPDGT